MIDFFRDTMRFKSGRYALVFTGLAILSLGSGSAFLVMDQLLKAFGMFVLTLVSCAIAEWIVLPQWEREIEDANKKGK
jgi:hypothetical protein